MLTKKASGQGRTDQDSQQSGVSGSRFFLGGLGERRVMYELTDDWFVQSSRQLDPAGAKGLVISADPALDLARRVDHQVSERVQLAEFAADVGEELLSAKTKNRSPFSKLLSSSSRADDDDSGESLTPVEAISGRGWWLCTPLSRFKDFAPSARVVPLTSVLLKLLEQHSRKNPQTMNEGATVVALVFPSVQGEGMQIVCLCTLRVDGHLDGLDFVTVSGLTIAQVISNYVSARRLDADGDWPEDRLVLATTADPQVKKWLSSGPVYPREQMFLGMPLVQAGRLGMILGASALLATGTASAYMHWQLSNNRLDINGAQAHQLQARSMAIAAIRDRSLGHVLSHVGLDSQKAIDLAVEAWVPGAVVELKASAQQATLTINAELGQSAPNVYSATAALVAASAPKGCSAAPAKVTSSLSQLVISYECTLQNTELERMRAAGF